MAPAELESLILSHPAVADVGVTSLPDELAGELPMAFVVRKDGERVTEEEIMKFVQGIYNVLHFITTEKYIFKSVKLSAEVISLYQH